ncbi:MAG: (2Fe-2S) ferredoxin domain-containing protein [Neisseriaceae bacterium]|nr:MAG: (2Fe-2S) ferredoxin domain-containing protein [Neisseriaceae bacterium]
MMFYNKHIFFCTNLKKNGNGCGDIASDEAFNFARISLRALDTHNQNKIGISKAGCLGRCTNAPVCVIYPEGVWYTYVNQQDIEEIIKSHLLNNKTVERLRIG